MLAKVQRITFCTLKPGFWQYAMGCKFKVKVAAIIFDVLVLGQRFSEMIVFQMLAFEGQ